MKTSPATILSLIGAERTLLAAFAACLGDCYQSADADLTQADIDAVGAELVRAYDNPEPALALVAEFFGAAEPERDPQKFERACDQIKQIARAVDLTTPDALYIDPVQ